MHRSTPFLFLILSSSCFSLGANADSAPPPTDGQWRGSITAGVSIASGNTRSDSGNIGADGTLATDVNKHHLYFTGLYGTQEDNQGVKSQTANLARAGGRSDHNLDVDTFTFASLDFEHDQLQRLDLRSVFGLGIGQKIIKTPETTFDVTTGITYNSERFEDFSRNSMELLLGEESTHKISENTSVKQRLAIYPNLREGGQYRVQFDAGLTTAINARLGLQLTLSDRYQSNPSPGIKNNDLLFLTSISYKIGPK